MDSDITPSNKMLQLQYCNIHERHWIWMVINLEYFIVNAIQIPKQCPKNQTIYMLSNEQIPRPHYLQNTPKL